MQRLFSKYKLIVLDWDCTVTTVRTCPNSVSGLTLSPTQTDLYLETSIFRNFVLAARDANVQVAIASYASADFIRAGVEAIFHGDNPFGEYILTPSTFGLADCALPSRGFDKNTMLTFLTDLTNIPVESTLFVDDSALNVARATRLGYLVLRVPACAGFGVTLSTMLALTK